MVMKNKLYKHHKHKAFFVFRNFAFAVLGLAGIGLSIAIPTYISTLKEQNIETKATSENEEKDFILITRKGIKPSEAELEINHRSQSSTLRIIEKK